MEEYCEHKNTIIWEPHLAGARKCKDCGMVYNPNMSFFNEPVWFFEVPEFNWKQEAIRLKKENAKLKSALKDLEDRIHYDINDATNAIFDRVRKLT